MKVKICGITRGDDAIEAVRLGASFIGFIFHAPSRRYVSVEMARDIGRLIPSHVGKIGVFVDQPADVVQRIASEAGLDIVQLHGDESPTLAKASFPRVWKVLRVSHASDADRASAAGFSDCEALLVDAKADEMHGGTGKLSDWRLASELARTQQVVLAGGINAGNAAEAVRQVKPWALDVSSGVETAPGKKCPKRMAALFSALADVG